MPQQTFVGNLDQIGIASGWLEAGGELPRAEEHGGHGREANGVYRPDGLFDQRTMELPHGA